MRINPEFFGNQDGDDEFDPDSKIETIESFDELPDAVQKSLASIKKKIRSMSDPADTDLIQFIAFQQLQISLLQGEITTIHKLLLMLSAAVDDKADK